MAHQLTHTPPPGTFLLTARQSLALITTRYTYTCPLTTHFRTPFNAPTLSLLPSQALRQLDCALGHHHSLHSPFIHPTQCGARWVPSGTCSIRHAGLMQTAAPASSLPFALSLSLKQTALTRAALGMLNFNVHHTLGVQQSSS